MTCPHDPIAGALLKCPFLHELSEKHGEQYARKIAINPVCPVSQHRDKPLLEEVDDYSRTLKLFHGSQGVVPLAHLLIPEVQTVPQQSDFSLKHSAAASEPLQCPARKSPSAALAAAPFASMSMSFNNQWPNFGDFFNKNKKQPSQPRPNEHLRKPEPQPKPKPKPRTAPSSSHITTTTSSSNTSSSGGLCPLRKALGPFAGLVFNKQGHVQCPEAIIKARAALAATKPVKGLRPQALGVKLLAVGATTAVLNVPCGAWREHTEKFSLGWFAAVHATIPFIAMLRKAVIMPKYAIIFTIAAAVAGQAIGAKMERQRMEAAAVNSPTQQKPARVKLRAANLQPARAMASISMGSSSAKKRPEPLWTDSTESSIGHFMGLDHHSFATVKGSGTKLLCSSANAPSSGLWLPNAVSVR